MFFKAISRHKAKYLFLLCGKRFSLHFLVGTVIPITECVQVRQNNVLKIKELRVLKF